MLVTTAALLLGATAAPAGNISDAITAARAAGCKIQHYPTPASRIGSTRVLTWCPTRTASVTKPAKRG